jgi:hypothetical protein
MTLVSLWQDYQLGEAATKPGGFLKEPAPQGKGVGERFRETVFFVRACYCHLSREGFY